MGVSLEPIDTASVEKVYVLRAGTKHHSWTSGDAFTVAGLVIIKNDVAIVKGFQAEGIEIPDFREFKQKLKKLGAKWLKIERVKKGKPRYGEYKL